MNKRRFKHIIEPAKNFTKASEVYNYLESIDDVKFMASVIAYGFGCTYDDYMKKHKELIKKMPVYKSKEPKTALEMAQIRKELTGIIGYDLWL